MSDAKEAKLQALMADLEASIASFDERFSGLSDDAEPAQPAGVRRAGDFPEIDPNARRDVVPSPSAPPPAERPPAAHTPLLDELASAAREQAEHVRSEAERRRRSAFAIGRALRLVVDYLEQLTSHLNVLQPPTQQDYAVDREHTFADLHWQDSSVRFETRSPSERSLIEKLTLRVRYVGQPLSLVVPDASMRRIENEMYLMNLTWRDAGVVDLPGQGVGQIGHRIEVDGSIPLQLLFTGDVDQERIILRCRNLIGLGLSAYAIAPAAVDAGALDTLGRCLLGRSRRLPSGFVPIAFNTPDSTA